MTNIMSDSDFRAWIPKLKVMHLRVEFDKEAGTAIGYDRDEVFMKAIQKDSETWIISTYKTKTVRWKNVNSGTTNSEVGDNTSV